MEGFVAVSDIAIEEVGIERLEQAFHDRLGKVDSWPGFRHLEVWQDEREPSHFVMVSWWDDKASFDGYMRSESHRQSHARIPSEPARPRPTGFTRYRIVAT